MGGWALGFGSALDEPMPQRLNPSALEGHSQLAIALRSTTGRFSQQQVNEGPVLTRLQATCLQQLPLAAV